MTAGDQIADLVLQWEAARHDGKQMSPEDLCQDCPQLKEELRERIEALEEMEQILGVNETQVENTLPSADDHFDSGGEALW